MEKHTDPTSPLPPEAKPKPASCPVVGVGASAGGLEAFSEVLRHLPEKTGLAFAFIQHLDPSHPSHLAEILGRATRLPVVEAGDGMPVEANHVYIIPPNVEMRIAGATLHLSPRTAGSGRHLPIDEFFRSLAEEGDGTAIGVVLSGNASDGTAGLKAIKAGGGITFAQDEKSAASPGMPRSAVAAGCVDFVLPPAEIARELARLGANPLVAKDEEATAAAGDALEKIFSLLRRATEVDFSQYKRTTSHRRIQRRMVVHRIEKLEDYAAHLAAHPEELDALYQDVLIHVTRFFREPETFEAMAAHVFPALVKDRVPDEPIRVWVPGCSTGEEAYSIAICLAEFLADKPGAPRMQIFGTDVSEAVVEQARKGLFDESIEADVSPERLDRFFTKTDHGWQIVKSLRERCVFARQNVIKDPPFSRLDFVSCRNVLIYFEPAAQKKLIPVFHYALRPGGFLLLGSAESIGAFTKLFEAVDAKHRIYSRREVATPPLFHGVELPPAARPREAHEEHEVWTRLDVQKEADRVLMARFCPPAIVVGENMEIIQFRGRVAPFVEPASGEASLNLFRMTRPTIEIELRATISRAKKSGAPVRKENVRIESNGGARFVNLEVVPLASSALRERCFIVLFEEPPAQVEPRSSVPLPAGDESASQLAQELAASQEHLQTVIEEYEAANEELRSANEEIQSSNEELQSTNEELETAKEEVQSTNEELTTLNEQLGHTNQALSEANDDLANLLRSSNLPIVMLDRELHIRRFTPVAQKILKLLPSDAGRAITELRLGLDSPDLEPMIRGVLDTLGSRAAEVRDREGRWWSLQVRPYETSANNIAGAVLILFDIDAAKRSAEQQELAAAYADAFLETVRNALLMLDAGLRVKRATDVFYKTFRVTVADTEGRLLYELGNGQWDIPELRELLEKILPERMRVRDFEVQHDFPGLGPRRMLLNARRLERDIAGEPLILLSIEESQP